MPQNKKTSQKPNNLDESLYSRQLYVLGTDTMSKLMSSTVFIYGMDGLGQEIAKNIILAGIHTLYIYDPLPVHPTDLCTGFYFRTEHIGNRRDFSVLSSLLQLNPYVTIQIHNPYHNCCDGSRLDSCRDNNTNKDMNTNNIDNHTTNTPTPNANLIVCANLPLPLSLHYNTIARKHNTPFISCQIQGLFSQIFTDFGPSFTTYDITGEPLLSGPINDISQEGILTTADNIRHELEDSSVIQIYDIPHLKDIKFKVKVLTPYKVKLEVTGCDKGEGDISNKDIKDNSKDIKDIKEINTNPPTTNPPTNSNTKFHFGIVEGGTFEEVKVPKTFYFQSLSQSLLTPDILTLPHSTPERDLILHKCFLTLNTYMSRNEIEGDSNRDMLDGSNPLDNNPLDTCNNPLDTYNNHLDTNNPLNNTTNNYNTLTLTPLDTNTFLKMYEYEYGNIDKNEKLIKLFCKQCCGSLMPMCSVIGGFVSQEVIKGCCNKYYPLHQFLYFECSMEGDSGVGLESVNDSRIGLEGVNDKYSSVKGVNDSSDILEGVKDSSVVLEGVSYKYSSVKGVNDSSDILEGVKDSRDKYKGVSNSKDSNYHPVNDSINEQQGVSNKDSNYHPVGNTDSNYKGLTNTPTTPNNNTPINRYTPLVTLFGSKYLSILHSLKIFLVGAGAIGCEHLKNLIMCGIGVNGNITVTDMDSIETSNLNRQFLFKKKDVQRMKSEVAVEESLRMNSDYRKVGSDIDSRGGDRDNKDMLDNKNDTIPNHNITIDNSNPNLSSNPDPNPTLTLNKCINNSIVHLPLKVGKETESVFSDTFLTNTSLVVNALDNIEARLYVDKRCITNKIPLFESGTLGTKGNVQVVIPYKTESYSSSRDPPDKSIPLCTIRNFPHCIEHTIEWALSEFKSNFEEKIISISEYIKGDNYRDSKLEGDNDSSSNYKGVSYKDMGQDPVNDSTDKQ
ncbi:ThiF-like ubiquitin-activating enzyme, partial [Hamiltosporidium tvaerminnensis]